MNYIFKSIRAVALAALCFGFFANAPQAFATPAVLTTPATSITQTTATLNGTVTSTATSVDYRFEWGTTPSLGNVTSYQTINSPTGAAQSVSAPITFTQAAGNNIYYRVMAVETGGTGNPFNWGTNLSFVVPAYATPSLLTYPATNNGSIITLSGFVNPNGATTLTVGFEYANNANFIGATTVGTTTIAGGNTGQTITATVSVNSLTPNQTYYFRIYATNAANVTTNGNALTFSSTQTASNCTITSFGASPTTIPQGSSTTLSWSAVGTGCVTTTLTYNGTTQTVTGQSTLTLTPTATTTYILTTTDSTGITNSATATVTVNTTGGNSCVLNSLYAASQSVSYGGTTTLYWNASGCVNLILSGGGINTNVSGYTSYPTPSITGYTTFTLTGTGNTGTTSTIQTTVSTNAYGNYCTINTFNAANTSVLQGSQTTLSWNTSNCTSVNLQGVGVYSYQTSGSVNTGILNTTTTYTLTASNSTNSTSQSVTVGVYATPLPPNPPYYPPINNQTLQVMTSAATNVFASSARLNGFAGNMYNSTASAYFEYGTQSGNLLFTSLAQNLGGVQSTGFYDTITNLEPNTFYYYRAVVTGPTGVVKGDIRFFKTTPETVEPNQITRYVDRAIYIERGVGENSSQVEMKLVASGDLLCNDKKNVTYLLSYKNSSNTALTNGTITITLPNDVTFAGTTSGAYDQTRHILILPVSRLEPGKSQTVTISGVYTDTTKSTLHEYGSVSATYEYRYETNKTGTARTFVATPLLKCKDSSLFAGLAFWGEGFWPSTLIGWIILLFLVLLLILAVRTVATRPQTTFQKRSY